MLDRIPLALLSGVGGLAMFAWLAGPIALAILALAHRARKAHGGARAVAAALMLSLLSLTFPIVFGTGALVATFRTIAQTGSGGMQTVKELCLVLYRSGLYGGLATGACLLVTAALVFRSAGGSGARDAVAAAPPVEARPTLDVVLIVLTVAATAAMLWLYYDMVQAVAAALLPKLNRPPAGLGVTAWMATVERDAHLLLFGGIPVMLFLMAGGVVAGRKNDPPLRHRALVATGVLLMAGALAWWAARLAALVTAINGTT